jgi:ABC-type phosphate transport system substrate-binding protein
MRASLPLTAERGRIRAAVAALCAMVALAVVAAAAPPSAHAAFALKACEGGSVQGEGSSFQRVAQAQFQLYFDSPFGCGEGAAITSPVTYVSDGSGCGIASIGGGGSSGKCSDFEITGEVAKGGYRDHKTRFGGSDAPMTPEQEAHAEAATGTNPGVLHTLPIANGATAVIVHFPEGCELENPAQTGGNANTSTGGYPVPEAKVGEVKAGEEDRNNDPSGKYTGDTFSEGTLRVHIPAETLEKIWDGTLITWGEVLNGHMAGTPTAPLEAEEGFTHCAEIPVRRLVRFDGSGTTYNFKAYLGLLPKVTPAGIWTKSPVEGTNTTWPLTTSSTGVPKAVPVAKEAKNGKTGKEIEEETKEFASECNLTVSGPSRICTGSANGNPFVASAVAATDGSIGYSDLATAREKGFTITKKAHDHTYWVPLQTINPEKPEGERVGTNYVEPTATPTSNIENGGPNGSNCTNADYRGIPTEPASDPTLGNWSKAIATGSKDTTTYPNCALTYDFAWDDDAPVYGNTPEEQSKARTVKDYFTFVESEGGQQSLTAADYGALSPEIISIARKGVEAIGWNKAAGAGGKTEETVKQPTSETKTGTTPGVAATTPPSNVFSIASGKVKGKNIVLSLVLPDAGQLQIKATGGGVTVSNVTASIGMGQGTVTLPISSAALKKLAKSKSKKLSVTITVTFTPTGGTAATQKKTLTITQASIAGKGKAKGKKKKGKKKG